MNTKHTKHIMHYAKLFLAHFFIQNDSSVFSNNNKHCFLHFNFSLVDSGEHLLLGVGWKSHHS